MRPLGRTFWFALLTTLPVITLGCTPPSNDTDPGTNTAQVISDAVNLLNANINTLQTLNPATLPGLPQGVAVSFYGDFLSNPGTQLSEDDLENGMILAFENVTPNDVYVTYRVDGTAQSVFVLQGQTVVIRYSCLSTVQLVSNAEYDHGSGAAQGPSNFSLATLVNPADFTCGQILIFSISDVGWPRSRRSSTSARCRERTAARLRRAPPGLRLESRAIAALPDHPVAPGIRLACSPSPFAKGR
jgi:hypothetical protein